MSKNKKISVSFDVNIDSAQAQYLCDQLWLQGYEPDTSAVYYRAGKEVKKHTPHKRKK